MAPTTHLGRGAACAGLGNATTGHALRLAGARGEVEQRQILVEALPALSAGAGGAPARVSLAFSDLVPVDAEDGAAPLPGGGGGGPLGLGYLCGGEPEGCWDWWQVGYVFCNETERYQESGGGWRPDPLLAPEPEGVLLEPGAAQPLWVRLRIPRDARPGRYAGSLWLNDERGYRLRSFLVYVTVWDFEMPPLDRSAWNAIFAFTYHETPEDNAALHPPHLTAATKRDWFKMLTDHRLPPDSLYHHDAVRDLADVLYLAEAGQRWINLLNVSKRPKDGKDLCADVSDDHVSWVLDQLGYAVPILRGRGLLGRAYVYGFDESKLECEPGVRKIFGAVKGAFPDLRTVAALGAEEWNGIPEMEPPLPLDGWVRHFLHHNATSARAWADQGKSYFLYHSIMPNRAGQLNTFIERPLISARLMMWLGAGLADVTGWLYYAVDSYATGCSVNPEPHHTLRRLGSTAMVDFNPGNCIWWPKTDLWANGDGQFTYPGNLSEPVGTTRLANFLDGLEDVELLKMLPQESTQALARQLARSLDDWTDDGALLEEVRLQAAAAVTSRA